MRDSSVTAIFRKDAKLLLANKITRYLHGTEKQNIDVSDNNFAYFHTHESMCSCTASLMLRTV